MRKFSWDEMRVAPLRPVGLAVLASLLVASCGGGGSGSAPPPPPPPMYTVGGTVSGLGGAGLVLQDNGGDNTTLAAGATSFTFPTELASGAAYAVTVSTQPTNPTQVCTVSSGSGTVSGANVTNVAIACTTRYTVGGTITGLTGTGLVLEDNGAGNMTVAAGATSFTFPTELASGAAYAVTVSTQPTNPTQVCTVSSGSGTVSGANVTNVAIACTTRYTVGGTITGLTGTGLVLQDNGADNTTVAAGATSFTFPTALAGGAAYAVTVSTQPSNPTQSCTVANGTGNVGSANVTNVVIACTSGYTIGGSITGLSGGGLVLQDNGGNSTPITAGAKSFTFSTPVLIGAAYAVTASTQPSNPTQFCTITNGSGTVASGNVTSVAVSCVNVGKYLFVANQTDAAIPDNGDVAVFAITQSGPSAGALTPVANSPFGTDPTPVGMVVDPSGQYVYVAAQGADGVDIMGFNSSTGALTYESGNPVSDSGISLTTSVAVAPSGQYLFAGGGQEYVDAFSLSSGQVSFLNTADNSAVVQTQGLAVDPASQFLFATDVYASGLTVFGIGGSGLTFIEKDLTGVNPYAVVVDPTADYVYVTNQIDGTISAYSYNAAAAPGSVLTPLADSPYTVGNSPTGITIDPSGQFLYVTNSADGTVSAFTIDPSSGALTSAGAAVPTGNISGGGYSSSQPMDVKVDPSSQFAYVANFMDNSVSLFTITPTTGALTLSGTVPVGAAIALGIE